MRFILPIVVILLANILPTPAQSSQCRQFIGTIEDVQTASEDADHEQVEMVLKRNKFSKSIHHYLFHSNVQWFLFDSKGDSLAYKLLDNKKGNTKQTFMVKGYLIGDVISVENICDISIQQF